MTNGALLSAAFADFAPQFGEQKTSAAQAAGLRYQARVVARLQEVYPTVRAGPWLLYKFAKKKGICQPDALVWTGDQKICVVEIKLSWHRSARPKLLSLYGPIVAHLYPGCDISWVQLYKNWKRGAHKQTLSIDELSEVKPQTYREVQWIGL